MPTRRAGFLFPNDPLLTKIAQPIHPEKITAKETEKYIAEMFDKAYGEQKNRNKPILVGLAAPQIGISKRIILVDTSADGHGGVSNLRVYINPEITCTHQKKQNGMKDVSQQTEFVALSQDLNLYS